MTGTAVLSSLHSRYTSSVTVHRQRGKVSERDTSANTTDADTQRRGKHIAYFRGTNGDASQLVRPTYVSPTYLPIKLHRDFRVSLLHPTVRGLSQCVLCGAVKLGETFGKTDRIGLN